LFGKLPHQKRAAASFRRLNGSRTGIDKEQEMNGTPRMTMNTRLILTDFAASLVIAVSIGLATSVALAGAVVLIAGQADVQSAPQGGVDPGSPS
jgi:hypothetical protein